MKRVAWWLLVVALTAATLVAVGVGSWQLLTKQSHPVVVADQSAARQAAIDAASNGTVKILSYSPDTLEQDFAAAKACLTGDFLNSYDQFTRQIIEPAARTKRVTAKAKVVQAGVESLAQDSASILVFTNQTTTSTGKSDSDQTSSAMRVGMTKVKGRWLINRFDPV